MINNVIAGLTRNLVSEIVGQARNDKKFGITRGRQDVKQTRMSLQFEVQLAA